MQNPPQSPDSLIPNAGQLAQTQEEYIRALEMVYQLLQREVEHLRQQRRTAVALPDSATASDETSHDDISAALLSMTDSADVIAALALHCKSEYEITPCNVFFFSRGEIAAAVELPGEEELFSCVKHCEEQGIIDWVAEQNLLKIIPNFLAKTTSQEFIVLLPLMLRGSIAGVFAGFTRQSDCKEADQVRLTSIVETAAITLDNVRSAAEIVRMNKRLNILNRQMLQSSKLASIGELAGTVAHEINNPLQILLAHLQLLETGVGDPERRMEVIKRQVFRISDITRRLLDFARSAPAEILPAPHDILAIIDDVLLFVGSQLNRDGIQVVKQYDDKEFSVLVSKPHIEQVLLNILLNARDAMPDGGSIVIGAFVADKRTALISISDSGVGIKPENLDNIFDPFFSTKPRGKGTGLGLSITKAIIQQHNGNIEVASQPGLGSTFKITLPMSLPSVV